MRWPNPTDYQDAVQNPKTCFHDPELKAGQVALLPIGLPRVASGNFASVYEIQTGVRRWAVRCFLRQALDQQRHYEQISRHLQSLRLPFLVGFEYQTQGIRVSGQTYPIVKMQWVNGVSLHTYIRKQLRRPQALRELAAKWRGLANSLHGSRMAHGDLQHGNVMVSAGGQIRLVDYDAMYVPALHGSLCTELGHANYQHPKRAAVDNSPSLDYFAALVIYASLQALAASPALWDRFHTGDNLIFSAADFKNPAASALFQELRTAPFPHLQALGAELALWCSQPLTALPDLETALLDLPGALPAAAVVAAGSSSSRTPVTASVPPSSLPPQNAPPPTSAAPWWLQAITSARQTTPPSSAHTASRGAVLTSTPAAGHSRINRIDGAKMVWVPEGEFLMGSNRTDPHESPERKVWLDGFWIYRHAVSVAQYRKFCAATGHPMPPEPEWGWHSRHPIVSVRWDDALAYCQWAGVRLPTEAQWEKAARGTDGRFYPWGDVWNEKYCRNAASRAKGPVGVSDHPSGASPFGALNMAGNAAEWCQDLYDPTYYRRASNRNPAGPSVGSLRVYRGGSWQDDRTALTTVHRKSYPPSMWLPTIGFRCAALHPAP